MIRTYIALGFTLFFSHIAFANNRFELDKLEKEQWQLGKSQHFEVVSDLESENLKSLVEELEQYRFFLVNILHLDLIENNKPLRILAISTKDTFANLGLPTNWAGVFSLRPKGFGAVANVTGYRPGFDDLTFGRQVLFHEYNHYIHKFVRNYRKVPAWYEEGSAEYFAAFKYMDGKVTLGDLKVLRARASKVLNRAGEIDVDTQTIFTTKALDMRSEYALDKRIIHEFYAKSAFIMHYMNSSPELRESLDVYLKAVNEGKTEEEAVKLAFNLSFEGLDKAIKNYLLHNMKVRSIDLAAAGISFPEFDVNIQPLDTKAFSANLAYIFGNTNIMNTADLRTLFDRALTLNPDNPELLRLKESRSLK